MYDLRDVAYIIQLFVFVFDIILLRVKLQGISLAFWCFTGGHYANIFQEMGVFKRLENFHLSTIEMKLMGSF